MKSCAAAESVQESMQESMIDSIRLFDSMIDSCKLQRVEPPCSTMQDSIIEIDKPCSTMQESMIDSMIDSIIEIDIVEHVTLK